MENNYLKKWNHILVLTLIMLSIANFILTKNNYIIWFAIILIVLIPLLYTILFNDLLSVILVFLLCSTFTYYLRGAGGIFTITFPVVILLLIILNKKYFILFYRIDFLFSLFILFNVIGQLSNPNVELEDLTLGILMSLSFFLIYHISKQIKLNYSIYVVFIKTIIIINGINLFIIINTTFNLIPVRLPLFFQFYENDRVLFTNSGSFGSTELMGEFSLISFILIATLYIIPKRYFKNLNFSKNWIKIGMITSSIIAILSFSRVITILLILNYLLIFGIFPFFGKRKISTFYDGLIVSLSIFIGLLLFGNLFNLDYLFDKFSFDSNFLTNFFNNPLSGVGTSREDAFKYGMDMISKKNWLIGDGYFSPSMNKITWFNDKNFLYSDYHNLYMSSIPVFGWIGTSLLLLVFVKILYNLYRIFLQERRSYLNGPIVFGWILVWMFFLIDEYKITMLRLGNYVFIVFLLMGFTNSLVLMLKKRI